MLILSGSVYNNSEIDATDEMNPLTVTSCGHYILKKRPNFETKRPHGRKDFQMLYVMKGKSMFEVDGQRHTVEEGGIVLYYPREPQQYVYELRDSPDIYWVHFTGNAVFEILKKLGLDSSHVFNVKVKEAYGNLFDHIIRELQLKGRNYEELANTYLYELLVLMSRSVLEDTNAKASRNEQIERAIRLFHSRFNEPLSLSEFAKLCNMSTCWFTRIFHSQMGISPQQYLTEIRINKAKELLDSSSYNIAEIGLLIGFQNPLYFSRIFKSHTGYSPTDYRKRIYVNISE